MRTLSADWVLPVEGDPIRDGAVVVGDDGRIAAVGAASELGEGERFERSAIVPGFVNAHTHVEYAVYAGFGDGLPFGPWIGIHIGRKQRLEDGDELAVARLGAFECLRSGVTTIADYSFSGMAAVACGELGLRAIVCLEVFAADPAEALRQFDATRERVGEVTGDVTLGISPHAPYTCSVETYLACGELGIPVGTHLAESEAETEWLLHGRGPLDAIAHFLVDPYGDTAIRTLAGRGALGPHVLAAHCVHADADEIGLLARHGVAVAHCPRSNALLGCGAAPLAELRAATARVGLGTDSPASTPSLDYFAELRAAVMTARTRERRPDALTGTAALELATLGGARALGLERETGSLVAGKLADLAIVSLDGSPFLPWDDPAAAVVLGGSPARVTATLVAGEERYRKGRSEWRELTDDARRARSRMVQ